MKGWCTPFKRSTSQHHASSGRIAGWQSPSHRPRCVPADSSLRLRRYPEISVSISVRSAAARSRPKRRSRLGN
jgi:hypothetical protein